MANGSNNVVEAYKMVIDYNKVIISFSSTILAGQIAFLVFHGTDFIWTNYLSSVILVATIILSLNGFGKAIKTVKTANSSRNAILFTNLSAYALIAGILLIGIIQPRNEKSLDAILEDISVKTSAMGNCLTPGNCKKIELKGDTYNLAYQKDTALILVTYSTTEEKIVSLK